MQTNIKIAVIVIIFNICMLFSCKNNEPIIFFSDDKFSIEIVSEMDGIESRSHVGGTTSGAGLYAGGEKCTVRAIPNDGYELESFTDEENKRITGEGYTFDVWVNRKFTAKFKKKEPVKIRFIHNSNYYSRSGEVYYLQQGQMALSVENNTKNAVVQFTAMGQDRYMEYDSQGRSNTKEDLNVTLILKNGESKVYTSFEQDWHSTWTAGHADGWHYSLWWFTYSLVIDGTKVVDNVSISNIQPQTFVVKDITYEFSI